MTDFSAKVLTVVKNIPKGQVMSYRRVAEMAGSPQAARAVANLMAQNFDPAIPCHRVVKSDGRPGGYNRGGESAKRAILRSEGVTI